MSTKQRDLYARSQRRLVASLLADGSNISRVLESITVEDVEEPSYNLIFSVMADLARANQPISDITVGSRLEEQGNLRKAGGPSMLFSLVTEGQKYLLDAPVSVYASIVKEAAAKAGIRRELQEAGSAFKDDSGVNAADAVSDLQGFLNEKLLRLSDASTISKFSDSLDDYFGVLDERKEIAETNSTNEGLQGIPTLLPSLNKYTNGWKPGYLVTVGARTGIGKSVMAINCAVAAVMSNKSTMFFSLEMSKEQIIDRVVASTTSITLNNLKTGNVNNEERQILKEQLETMKDMKLIIDTEPKITVDGIRARALRQAQSSDGLDFIIVDYLQLITPSGRFSSRQEAVADISRNMKLLAKQLGVPIMVLVQLNRKSGEEDGLPELDNIRESGAIAQDSDVVILIHRDKSMDGTTPHTLVLLAKNRDGEADKIIRCHSILECSIFKEITRVDDAEGLEGEDGDINLSTNFTDGPDDDIDLADFGNIDDIEDLELEL